MKIYNDTYSRAKTLSVIYAILMLVGALAAFGQSSFSGARLEDACRNYIYSRLGNDVEISIMQKIRDKSFKESGVTARFTSEPSQLRGLCQIGLEFTHNDRLLERITIPAKIKIFEETFTAAKSLQSGAVISESDIATSKAEVSQYEPDELPLYHEIIGSRLGRSLAKGSIITRGSLEKPKVINRGERVPILVFSGTVSIRTQGTALNDAVSGETVRVKSDNSNSVLSGTAGEDGVVYISGR